MCKEYIHMHLRDCTREGFLKAARAGDAGAGNLEHKYMSRINRTIMSHANIPSSPWADSSVFMEPLSFGKTVN